MASPHTTGKRSSCEHRATPKGDTLMPSSFTREMESLTPGMFDELREMSVKELERVCNIVEAYGEKYGLRIDSARSVIEVAVEMLQDAEDNRDSNRRRDLVKGVRVLLVTAKDYLDSAVWTA